MSLWQIRSSAKTGAVFRRRVLHVFLRSLSRADVPWEPYKSACDFTCQLSIPNAAGRALGFAGEGFNPFNTFGHAASVCARPCGTDGAAWSRGMEPMHRRVEPVEPVEVKENEECIFFKLYRLHRFHTPVHRFHASAPCGSIGSTRPCTNGRGMPRHIGFAPCLGQSREVPEETPVAVFSGMPFCMVNNESHSMLSLIHI